MATAVIKAQVAASSEHPELPPAGDEETSATPPPVSAAPSGTGFFTSASAATPAPAAYVLSSLESASLDGAAGGDEQGPAVDDAVSGEGAGAACGRRVCSFPDAPPADVAAGAPAEPTEPASTARRARPPMQTPITITAPKEPAAEAAPAADDDGSVPPVDIDNHFFDRVTPASDPFAEPEERDPRARLKATPVVAQRRAQLVKYVKIAVAASSALCLAALVKVAVAARTPTGLAHIRSAARRVAPWPRSPEPVKPRRGPRAAPASAARARASPRSAASAPPRLGRRRARSDGAGSASTASSDAPAASEKPPPSPTPRPRPWRRTHAAPPSSAAKSPTPSRQASAPSRWTRPTARPGSILGASYQEEGRRIEERAALVPRVHRAEQARAQVRVPGDAALRLEGLLAPLEARDFRFEGLWRPSSSGFRFEGALVPLELRLQVRGLWCPSSSPTLGRRSPFRASVTFALGGGGNVPPPPGSLLPGRRVRPAALLLDARAHKSGGQGGAEPPLERRRATARRSES